jgi:hypothetical protein
LSLAPLEALKLGGGAGAAAGGAWPGVEGESLKKRMEQRPPQGMAGVASLSAIRAAPL